MCMTYDEQATQLLRDKIAKGEVFFSKLYSCNEDNQLVAYYMGGVVKPDANGVIHSNRDGSSLTEAERQSGGVNLGIHVNVYSQPCQADAISSQTIKLPVSVALEDLVGCNVDGSHAVFTKISVDMNDVHRAVTLLFELREEGDCDDDDEDDWEDEEDDDDEEDEDDDEDVCDECGEPNCYGECVEEDDEDEEDPDWLDDE